METQQMLVENLRLAGGYDSSDEQQSSMDDQSTGVVDCSHSETAVSYIGRRPVKSGAHTMIDKKIFLKFNKLTKTLKETRSNLLTVDQMLGKYKGDVRLQKSEPVFDQGGHPRMRRASSLPPPLRNSDCRLCGGDNQHQVRSQSVDNFEVVGLYEGDDQKLSRSSQSMQDLRLPDATSKSETILSPVLSKRDDQKNETCGDSMRSAKGSEMSFGDQSPIKHQESYPQSPQPSNMLVEELRVEVLALKTQLNKMQANGQFQGQNLLLCQQLENREQQIGEMTRQLQELSNKLDASEDQRRQLMLKLEETLRTSLDVGSEAERFAAEVKRLEQTTAAIQADKDKLRRRARKVVQDLKEKCKQYVSDLQRLREREWELEQRCNQSFQDKAVVSSQLCSTKEKLQETVAELEMVKGKKCELEEVMQKKEIETAEIKAVHQELQLHLQQFKDLYQKLAEENDSLKLRVEELTAEKSRLESKLAVSDKEVTICRQHLEDLRTDVKEVRSSNSELLAQSLTESTLRQAVEQSSQETVDKVRNLEKQLEEMQLKYLEAVNEHGKIAENLRNEMITQKLAEEQKYQEALKVKQQQYEARFTAFKLDLAENQATVQTLQEALIKEQEAKTGLKNDLVKGRDDYGLLEAKYHRVLRHYHSKKRKNQDKEQKIQLLQDSLVEVQEMGTSLEEDFKDILRLIFIDVDVTTNLMHSPRECPEVVDSDRLNQMHTRELLTGIKSKLRWLQDELRRDSSCRHSSTPRPQHTVSVDSIHTNKPTQQSPMSVRSIPGLRENIPVPYRSPVAILDGPRDRPSSATESMADRSVSLPALHATERSRMICHSEPVVPCKEYSIRLPERTPSYPFNSTAIKDFDKTAAEADQAEIFRRYQRFQQIFEDVHTELNAANKVPVPTEHHEESSKGCHLSTGLLSITSSLSSISEFSTETAVVAPDQTSITILDDYSQGAKDDAS